jgi:hypothetical protein
MGLELAVFVIFLASLGGVLIWVLETWRGVLLVAGTLTLGLLLPLALHLGLLGAGRPRVRAAVVCALLGGLVLRYAVVMTPSEMLARGSVGSRSLPALSETWEGMALVAGVMVLAVLVPVVLLRSGASGGQVVVAGVAGLVIFLATLLQVLATPDGQPTARLPALAGFSPEDGRAPGGGVGASALNRPNPVPARTKVKGMQKP